jgi:PAS domain-containing protein
VDVTEIVRAQQAQKNFVQTLTKTFATLSIGLAIFDRNRQLMLFNPALIDLTALPPIF